MLGLICAGMLAASMSTYSSYLLCWSSVLTQDVIAPLVPGGLSAPARIALTRVWVVLIGAYLVVFGLFYYTPDIWKFLAGTSGWMTNTLGTLASKVTGKKSLLTS